MLRIAIVETNEYAKEILFAFCRVFDGMDHTFQYFIKLSDLAKAQREKEYQIIVFHEQFDTSRIHGAFIHDYANRIIIYTSKEESKYKQSIALFDHIFYIDRNHIYEEIQRIQPCMDALLKNEQQYFFSYNNINVALKISEIYFIEKDNKNLIYHTKKGSFSERKSMKVAQDYFEPYQFIRIHSSFLVNRQYLDRIEQDNVYVGDEILPLARARRNDVLNELRILVKS